MKVGKQAISESEAQALSESFSGRLGPKGVLCDRDALAPYLIESRGLVTGWTPFMVMPANTDEVVACIQLAREHGVSLVPQGGNTSRVGGALSLAEDRSVLLNLHRMDHIRSLDPLDNAVTVEAGCVLASLQKAAADADRLFPLSLGAEGSCQIGGNLATNAGGIHVLRYGNMRDLVLGLEVVLPDATVWSSLGALRKDNTGYDLKHLFLGSEGSLGIITAATLKLFPRPLESVSAFVGLSSLDASVEILARARRDTGDALIACELIPRMAIDLSLAHMSGAVDPLSTPHEWYLLMEATAGRTDSNLRDALEATLGAGLDQGLIVDGTLAASEAQARAFWRLREILVEAQVREGASIKHDISVPTSRVPDFIRQANRAVEALVPGIRPYPFGHIGDGNIHYNLTQPKDMTAEAFRAEAPAIHRSVHDITHDLGGSISAEHGIGRFKVRENIRYKSPVELALMQKIKDVLDPDGLMNPGVILPSEKPRPESGSG
ncbi:MAG: FAD-binding oxidoreductase [Pseudomonadota bacterium]